MNSRTLLIAVALLSSEALQGQVSVRILLGVGDNGPVRWDGTIAAQGAKIASIEPWRFEGTDAVVGSTWHVTTHPIRLFGGGTQVSASGVSNVVANGIIVNLSAPQSGAELKLTTAQGDFNIAVD